MQQVLWNKRTYKDPMTALARRQFLRSGLGSIALAWLAQEDVRAQRWRGLPHFTPKARRVIYLFQSGAPSQMDLFDYKPGLRERRGEDLPGSVRMGQRLTGMTATQDTFPVAR